MIFRYLLRHTFCRATALLSFLLVCVPAVAHVEEGNGMVTATQALTKYFEDAGYTVKESSGVLYCESPKNGDEESTIYKVALIPTESGSVLLEFSSELGMCQDVSNVDYLYQVSNLIEKKTPFVRVLISGVSLGDMAALIGGNPEDLYGYSIEANMWYLAKTSGDVVEPIPSFVYLTESVRKIVAEIMENMNKN